MKKLITFVLAITLIGAAILIAPKSTPTKQYAVPNALYLDGEVITPKDQFIWAFEDDTIPQNTVVVVVFDDNGTPDYLEDDCIINITKQQ